MNKEIILSIAIPTYNRVKFLETTVDIFVSQIKAAGLEEQVEIVIGDDASPDDNTVEYITELDKKHSFVHAIAHPKNIGVTANIISVFTRSQGKYIWGFGEDDLITEQALEKVLDCVKNDDPNIIILNTINMTSEDDRNLKYKLWGENRLNITEDIFIESFQNDKGKLANVNKWLYMSNLISSVVFKKEIFFKELSEAKKLLRPENVYLFQAPLLIGLSKYGRLKLMAERIVLHRKNENHWSGKTSGLMQINLYDASEAVKLVKKYLPSEYKAYQKIFTVHVFVALKKAKQKGEKVNKYIIDAIKKYHSCFPYSIRFVIALLLPSSVFKLLAPQAPE